jgi:hypothetical protein
LNENEEAIKIIVIEFGILMKKMKKYLIYGVEVSKEFLEKFNNERAEIIKDKIKEY